MTSPRVFFPLVGGQVPLPGRGGGGGGREERRAEDGRRRYAENNLAQQVSQQGGEGDRVSLSLFLGGSRFADTRPGGGTPTVASQVGLGCVWLRLSKRGILSRKWMEGSP